MPPIGINRVMLIGEVASPPHYKLTKDQRLPRLWLRVRTDERYREPSGAEKVRRGFHSVVVWGNHATALHGFLREGHAVAVDGRLSTRAVERASGPKRYETEVVASTVVVLTPREPDVACDAA